MYLCGCTCRWYRFRCIGGLGLAILSFGFGLKPAGLPIDVMFMIMAVVAAAAAMQAAGGLDYMIKIATKNLTS